MKSKQDLIVSFNQTPLVSYALIVNGIDVISEITVSNNSDKTFTGLEVHVSFDPEFADAIVEHIEELPAKENWQARDLDLSFNPSYLCNLTEAVSAKTTVRVVTEDGELLAEAHRGLEVLDYCQYWGNNMMQPQLAAFVTPRHIALDPIINRASALLSKWTKDSSMTAYYKNVPARPKMIVGALYEAISEQNITYCCATMTLANLGQKIRTCEELLSQDRDKRGCCLDMALLMCSCLEAVGLNPLLVVQDTHAFVGCWLIDDLFEDCINDDPTVLTKRAADGINEIVLVEMTCANEGLKMSFDEAVAIGADKAKDVEKFSFVLDVARARLAGVRPIPQRIFNGHEYVVANPDPDEVRHSSPVSVGKTYTFRKNDSEPSRFDQWERRLLDLTTRNNLLHIRFFMNTLRIMVPSLDGMAKLLDKGKSISVINHPDEWEGAVYSDDLGVGINRTDPVVGLLKAELQRCVFRTYYSAKTLSQVLTYQYRSARLSIEESGANTLYVALGFLKWYESGGPLPHYAPLVLYPVKMERKSASNGYSIASRDEDALVNETLFEFLCQNYDIEMPDITDALHNAGGVDVNYILAAVRSAIKKQDRWDVVEEATLGIFDFSRFVIWNDLRTNRYLMEEHPLVDSLLSGQLDESMADEADAVEELPSDTVALPISADSSQLDAIHEAASGRSFVLHGPPGTGKSQTITNIISNALFHGKRVLFVAEKMAALEVVQKRLAAIGLAPFCLELHSNKTKKSLVMEQLRRTTEVVRQAGDDAFVREAARLDELKRELNGHVERLHSVKASGLSIYDCFARYSSIDAPDSGAIRFSDEHIDALTPDSLRDHSELVENFQMAASVVAESGNALREVNALAYSPNIRTRIEGLVNELQQMSADIQRLLESAALLIGVSSEEPSRAHCDAMYAIAEFFLGEEIPAVLIGGLNGDSLAALRDLAALRVEMEQLRVELFERFDEHILDIDYAGLRQSWTEAGQKWFVGKYFARRSLIKRLSAYSLSGRSLASDEVLPTLDKLGRVSALQKDTDEVLGSLGYSLGVKRMLQNACAQTLMADYERLNKLHSALTLLGMGRDALMAMASEWCSFKARNAEELKRFVSEYADWSSKIGELEELTCSSLGQTDKCWLVTLSRVLERWSWNMMNLRSKVAYNVVRKQMCGCGLASIAEAFESGAIRHDGIVGGYEKSLYKHCANRYISQDKEMSFFQSVLFEDKIKRFRKLCKRFEDITRRELVVRLSAQLPALRKEASQGSEVGILQKCIRNGCRGKSIRKLFEEIPDLISRMCPAMLMSPLSVSQYLSMDWPQFDLVIFDEASQMPTCEAVASISRGKCVVVVGDEHQLPPTSFFMASNFSERHSESEDLESILDDCLALSMPQKHLLWHYRSKHESLIAFSNRHFYKNALMTFPSNDDMATKVSFEYVNGVYERGTGRNNKAEAKAVVAEIKKRLSDPQTSSQSIGVVTFNVNQQSLIEDKLNDMLHKNPDLEAVVAQMHEPIFIKNLENVQGDERDVILFSVGYGRDRYGKMTMNFGPLNRDGGERRLNVAVSRARYEMKIFSSLKADDINIESTNARGVRYLKSFLEYAEGRRINSVSGVSGEQKKAKDALVESVAAALRSRGYEVNANVGASKYRVDIGVVDPDNRERYLLGLICDGYNYNESHAARDRDVAAPAVLSLLGWHIYNVWSVEWWDTPEQVLDGVVREIERVRTNGIAEEETTAEEEGNVQDGAGNAGGINDAKAQPEIHEATASEYTMAVLPVRMATSAALTHGLYTDAVKEDIRAILDAEAPISRRLLIRRLLKNYGIRSNNSSLDGYLNRIFSEMGLVSTGTDCIFFWKDKEQQESYAVCRKACGRDALDIAPEEVAQAILQVVRDQFAIGKESLISEAARLFGYACVRDNILASMTRGLDYAIANKWVRLDGERYRIS